MAEDPSTDFAAAQLQRLPRVAAAARGDRAVLAMGVSLVMMLGAATLFAMSRRAPAPPGPATEQVPDTLPAPPLASSQPALVTPAVSTTRASLLPATAEPVVPAPRAPATDAAAIQGTPPGLIFDTSPDQASISVPAAPQAAGATVSREPLSPEEAFARKLLGDLPSDGATRIENPGTTIAQGTLITAVLETAIDSDTPGFVRALISRDVRSFDGTAVLIPRGSHVIGQYKSGLAVGQTRAYVLWTRLLRPDGVSVDIGSPATDYAGRAGLTGEVDSHFGKRFGAAILLSLIGAAGQAIGGGTAVILAGPQQVAQSSTQQTLAIPPTVRVPLGAPIRIFIARDLDFRQS